MQMVLRVRVVLLTCGLTATAAFASAQTPPPTAPPTTTQTPVPKPFPGSNPATPAPAKPTPPPAQAPQKPAAPTTPPAQTPAPATEATVGAPSEAALGVKIFPGALYLESFDAGRGQRVYLFGTNAPYAEVVAFYKSELKGGSELFKEPAMQQFELPGVKFQKDLMAYPPSVVVKDYTWAGLTGEVKPGYAFVNGTTEKRFTTILQIVPAPVK